VILTATKLPDGNFIANCEDITERKELEKQLQEKERLAAIGQTAGMVGHDIRNPLQAMTSDLYLIKEELKAEDSNKKAIAESLGSIEQNIDYVNKIVSDLQDYTRPIAPNRTETNVKVLINEVIAALKVPQTIQTRVMVESELIISADKDNLRRILSNLILNAIQAMPSGGILGIQAIKGKNEITITVEDTGVGIPDDVKEKLFTPLFTTKAKGQGLGLAVVKHLVEGLNATISFESKQGKGTKFIIELPTS
jgi:signal transduction histidine kinase